MYIRYNNSTTQSQNFPHNSTPPLRQTTTPKPPYSKQDYPPPENADSHKCKADKGGFKNPLKFLPKEVYNPHTHKFFGKLSGEDILIIGLILMVLDCDCDEDIFLVLALLYILLSDWIDFGNIFS